MDLNLTTEITEIVNGEIGSDATLKTASPSGTASVRVVLNKDYFPKDVGAEVNWSSYEFVARGLAASFTNAKQNDTLTVGGVDYNIEDKYETDEGWCVMPLTVSS